MGGLGAAAGSSVHHAFDSDPATWFRSAAPLTVGQAFVTDLTMIYRLSKIEVKQQPGHTCAQCKIELSCDQQTWWPVHTFTAAPNEVVEWETEAVEAHDELGFPVLGAAPFPILARFVRFVATAPTPAPPPRADGKGGTMQVSAPAWHVQEVEVFGEELGDSLTVDAPVWLGQKGGAGGQPPLEAQADHPPSAATDADLNTGFRSLAAPAVGHTLSLDLQAVYRLALVELYQAAGRQCTQCVVEHSVDQQSWAVTTRVEGLRGFAAYGPEKQAEARYMQVVVGEKMSTVWEITELQVYGVPSG